VIASRTPGTIRKSPARRLVLEALEDRCLLNAPVPVPTGSNTALSQIFWNGGAPQPGAPYTGPIVTAAPTVKTITITNNSDQTIYPILRDANTQGNRI